MCNFFAKKLHKLDKKNILHFSSLEAYVQKGRVKNNSIIFSQNNLIYKKSAAIKKILDTIKYKKFIVKIIFKINPIVLDFFYDIISSRRYFLSKFFVDEKNCNLELKNKIIK